MLKLNCCLEVLSPREPSYCLKLFRIAQVGIPLPGERADLPNYIKITGALFSLAIFQEKTKSEALTKPWTGFNKSK